MSEKKPVSASTKTLPMIYPYAAGLDVGLTFHVVAVPIDGADEPVRTFRSFTADLYQLAS